jgi:molybdopterin converting factor small subunit
MQVTVKLFASFRLRLFKEAAREYPDGAGVVDIVNDLGIPAKELGIVLVNGRHASLNDLVQDGDVVSLMPHIGGG